MAERVLILGESGTGKSTSLRNFTKDEVYVISCAGKRLPFRNDFEQVRPRFELLTSDVKMYMASAASKGYKVLVIDDAQYIMSFQYMRRIKEGGWDKWNDIQGDFFDIINITDELPADMIVYFLSHLQRDENGREKIKTMGKLLDEKITIEGLFTNVLKTGVVDGQYVFYTQNNGFDTTKSSIGLFSSYAIDNDLKYVDTKLREFYGIGRNIIDPEQMAALDAVASKTDIEKPDAKDGGRKRRKRRTTANDENEKEKHEKAPIEETAQEATASANADNGADSATDGGEQPKRRRRRKRDGGVSTDDAALVSGVDYENIEVPFDTQEPTGK